MAALERDGVIERSPAAGWRIAEPFLAQWLGRQQRGRHAREPA